jgi:hypothetical protein
MSAEMRRCGPLTPDRPQATLAEARQPSVAWKFDAGASGKPEIDRAFQRSRLRFNMSHTTGLVVCAAGLDNEIGVDVEANDHLNSELELAEHFFAPEEISLLRGAIESERRHIFLRIWTLKEAYIKATGLGLACPLNSFAITLDPIGIRFGVGILDDPRNWPHAMASRTTSNSVGRPPHGKSARARLDLTLKGKDGETAWRRPNYATIHRMIGNPIYGGGAYAYGKTVATVGYDASNANVKIRRKARSDWLALMPNTHEG